MGALSGFIGSATAAEIEALNSFATDGSPCQRWYKNAAQALIRASNGDSSACGDIHNGGTSSMFCKCSEELKFSQGFGLAWAQQFNDFALELRGKCHEAALRMGSPPNADDPIPGYDADLYYNPNPLPN